jgi:putative heme iron utilization protein
MAQANKSFETPPLRAQIAADARSLVRRAFKGSLATFDTGNGYPYASLIIMATDPSGAPTFLISTLALHTRNLIKDPRASILIDGTGVLADPLQGARVTLFGRAETVADAALKQRFVARHLEAALYADFEDFSLWRLTVEGAHYIGGFGRIVDLSPEELLVSVAGADRLIEAESGIVEHMNQDHADALELYAMAFGGGGPGLWRLTGIDPEGCDLTLEGEARRVPFGQRVTTPALARQELVRLAEAARKHLGKA